MYLFLSLKARQSSILWSVLCRFHSLYHCCHSLSLIAICCHSLHYLLPLFVTCCATRCHSLSLDAPLVCLFINDQSRLPLSVGYFIYFNLHVLVQQFINLFSSIKETNWLMNKGMCVLLFHGFKHLLLRKTDVLKTCRKSKFLGKKICRNALAYKVYSGKPSVYKTLSQISFKLFCMGDKKLLSEFLRKWGWFQGHNERFPKYPG